jgi:hypothetical protein
MDTPFQLKQRAQRMTIMDLVEVHAPDRDKPIKAHIENISRTGMFISTDTPLPIGSHVKLKFVIGVEKFSAVSADGEVVRVVQPDKTVTTNEDVSSPFFESLVPGMGIRFTGLDPKSEDLIERSIKLTQKKHQVV